MHFVFFYCIRNNKKTKEKEVSNKIFKIECFSYLTKQCKYSWCTRQLKMYSFSLSLTLLSGFIGLGRPLVHTIHPDFDFTFFLSSTNIEIVVVKPVTLDDSMPWLWILKREKRKTKSSRGHHLQEEYARTGLDNSENILIFKTFALQQLCSAATTTATTTTNVIVIINKFPLTKQTTTIYLSIFFCFWPLLVHLIDAFFKGYLTAVSGGGKESATRDQKKFLTLMLFVSQSEIYIEWMNSYLKCRDMKWLKKSKHIITLRENIVGIVPNYYK